MTHLICISCGQQFTPSTPVWGCTCGGLLDIEHSPEFPINKLAFRKPTMWRYREAIPIEDDNNIVSFEEGFTPLLKFDFNGNPVLIKQEQLFSTGSYKDRGASVLISKVKELGLDRVVEDSSGNAGCAIAAYAARAGMGCEIYVPANTSAGKLTQLKYYNAIINRIPGSREDTAQTALAAAESIYYASHSYNPFFFHGTKTFAFEVCEQLGWNAPECVILPVGNGTLLLGAYIGFKELLAASVVETLPRIIGIQAANCAPLYKAYIENLAQITSSISNKETVAEGIAIAKPVRNAQILEAVKESKGELIAVDESEIKKALMNISRKGLYIEPTSAATIAGVSKYLEDHVIEGEVVSAATGHGLKATEKMIDIYNEN